MSSKLPPVPRENLSPKGAGHDERPDAQEEGIRANAPDPAKQGHQGNTKVNLTHQGHQQDR